MNKAFSFRRKGRSDGSIDLDASTKSLPCPSSTPTRVKPNRSNSMPPSMTRNYQKIKGIMKFTTLDESLHSQYGSERESITSCESSIRSAPANIQFGDIQIRQYARCVGDHPACSAGPPLSISWEYDPNTLILSVDDYENGRGRRRNNFEMIMPRSLRTDMLKKEWNVSQSEIAAAVRSGIRVKSQRRTTVNNLGKATKMELVAEKVVRRLKRAVKFKGSVSAEVQQLENQYEEVQRLRSEIFLREESEAVSDLKDEIDEPARSVPVTIADSDRIALEKITPPPPLEQIAPLEQIKTPPPEQAITMKTQEQAPEKQKVLEAPQKVQVVKQSNGDSKSIMSNLANQKVSPTPQITINEDDGDDILPPALKQGDGCDTVLVPTIEV